MNPGAAGKLTARLAARTAEDGQAQQSYGRSIEVTEEVAELNARSVACLTKIAFLGGYVPTAALAPGGAYDVRFLEDRVIVVPCPQAQMLAEIVYTDVEHVEIGGPGLVRTGGGFVGGGFGAAGAIEGMAIASVLNALTTRTSIKTVVRLQEEIASSSCSRRRGPRSSSALTCPGL